MKPGSPRSPDHSPLTTDHSSLSTDPSPLSTLGLLRSVVMYYGNPVKNWRMRRFYGQFIQPGDLCFDIGAHVGNRLRAWRQLGARCVAVEPQAACMRLLRRWYGQDAGVTLVEMAVGAAAGTQTMYVSRRTPTVTTLSPEWIAAVRQNDSFARVAWDAPAAVPVTTLDDLIAAYGQPAFCKIDVEGYELEVLRGLSQPLPALSIEYIPAAMDVMQGCLERLEQLGRYEYNWSAAETHRWRSPAWLTAAQMRAALAAIPASGRSGDVYARLCP